MFEEKAALFLYCVSPVHMGAGTAIGAIDNPIQRERHTQHPMMMGSGIKGALRHHLMVSRAAEHTIDRIFGPETNAAEHAGAVSFSDAQIVLFPVRSLRNSFVYTTSPTALARLKRLLLLANEETTSHDQGNATKGIEGWKIPESLPDEQCLLFNQALTVDGKTVVLESYQFTAIEDEQAKALKPTVQWLSKYALPDKPHMKFFRDKIEKDIVVLSDNRFTYFARNATVVEPHVRINDETGTADDGGLFYTENLPPESLLVSLVMASIERKKKGESQAQCMSAADILDELKTALDTEMVQVGGDATTGRGQIVLKFA